MPAIWRSIDWRHLAPMLVAGLMGVPLGTWVLPYISLATFKLGVGVLLIGYCSFMLLAPGRLVLAGRGRTAEAAVGFAGGVLGGLAGLSGALPTVWATLQGLVQGRAPHRFSGLQPNHPVGDAAGEPRAGPDRMALLLPPAPSPCPAP